MMTFEQLQKKANAVVAAANAVTAEQVAEALRKAKFHVTVEPWDENNPNTLVNILARERGIFWGARVGSKIAQFRVGPNSATPPRAFNVGKGDLMLE